MLEDYYGALAVGVAHFRDKEFWNYHKNRLEELGYPFDSVRLVRAVCMKGVDLILNPKQTIEKLLKHMNAK